MDAKVASNNVAKSNVKGHNNGKTGKELKFSEKDEVYTTETMYTSPDMKGDYYRDSGCFEEDNDSAFSPAATATTDSAAPLEKKNGTGSPPRMSAKTLEKKAQSLQKRAALHKPRQHSKSCSSSYAQELQQQQQGEAAEFDRIVQHLQNSSEISDARISYGGSGKGPRKADLAKRGHGLFWGKPGDELSNDVHCAMDENDPNYDSESEVASRSRRQLSTRPKRVAEAPTAAQDQRAFPLPKHSAGRKLVVSCVSQEVFERLITAWVDEYFDHGDVHEVCTLVRELAPTRAQLLQLPFLAISMALEKKPRQRELTSQLLSALCDKHGLLAHDLMEKAFDQLLTKHLEELAVDVPDAAELVGCFIARAVADDVIPPKFVEHYKGRCTSDVVVHALRKAENLLHIPHAYAHLDVVWLASAGIRGGGDSATARPTKQLTRAFNILLQEYLDARDKREVGRSLRELDAPHFLHEFMVLAVLLVVERSTEEACNAIVDLIDHIHSTGELSEAMIVQGVRRVYSQLGDLSLDVPAAYLIMDRFLKQALARGFISSDLVKEMPRKKRSRFISECVGRACPGPIVATTPEKEATLRPDHPSR